MNPVVSVITPCYNVQDFIEETAQSVQDQSFKDWELLLIDDASTDKTQEALQKLREKSPDRIRVFSLKKNSQGPAAPRNLGIAHALGPWLAFLDSDDIWHPDKLKIQLEKMRKEQAEFSCTQRVCFKEDPPQMEIDPQEAAVEEIEYGRLLKKNIISNSSVLIDRKALGELRFNESPSLSAVEDYGLWLDVLKQGRKCLKILGPLLFYREGRVGISADKFKMALKIRRMLKVHMGEAPSAKLKAEYYWTHNLFSSALQHSSKKTRKAM